MLPYHSKAKGQKNPSLKNWGKQGEEKDKGKQLKLNFVAYFYHYVLLIHHAYRRRV